jgi:hypothetical protein
MGDQTPPPIFEQIHAVSEHYRELLIKNYENNFDRSDYQDLKRKLLAEHQKAIYKIFVENHAVLSDGKWIRQDPGCDTGGYRSVKVLALLPHYTVVTTAQGWTYFRSELHPRKKEWARQARQAVRKAGRYHKICKWCGQEFVSVRSDAEYCPNEKCRKAAQRAKKIIQ